jgi:hypothetical protein
MTTVYIAIAVAVAGLLAGLPGWLTLRKVNRLGEDFAAIFHAMRLRRHPEPPPDGDGDGDGDRPKRHLRIVSVWIPLAAALGWLTSRIHPAVGAMVALTAATATVATLVILVPRTPSDDIGLPATAPHRSRRTYTQPPPDRPPTLSTSRQPTSSPRPTTVLLPRSSPVTTSRPPVPSMLPTTSPLPTTGSTIPLPTIAPPTITTTVQVPPRRPLLCLDVGLPLAAATLDLGDCTSGQA